MESQSLLFGKDKMRKLLGLISLVTLFLSLQIPAALARPAFLDRRAPDEQQHDILEKSAKVLSELYKHQPEAKTKVESAYGYATFSNLGVKILFAGGGSGRGLAINNKTRAKTYMNMAEVQAGLGLGVKKFMLVWVFENEKSFNEFVNSGWAIGGQASAAAKAGDRGGAYQGAVSIADGIWLYQLTDAGLALELTVKGTKYYKDNDLN
jgi:lipid-binding SYLF domain-containing protein